MPVEKYRSIDEMPPPWRHENDPGNLRAVARAMGLYRAMRPIRQSCPRLRRYRNVAEMNLDRDDPYRREDPRLGPPPSWAHEV
jgi:hypothetical protein